MAKGGGRKYNRDKNGKFASTGGARLGGKSKGPKLGSGRPGTSAPGGTVAKSSVNRSLGATRGAGKGSVASAPAAGGNRRGVKMGAGRPGTSAPKGTIAKSAVNRTLGATRGYGKGSTATPPAPKPKAKKGPKTASGRAGANLRSAQKQLNKNPMSKKAQNSLVTAQAAKDYYKTMGGGRKGAAKPKRKGKK